MEFTNIMVVDDYLLVAESIKELLKANLRPCLIKHFDCADEAKKELIDREYHYLFIGINTHGRIGTGFISALRIRFPQLIIIALCSEKNPTIINSLFTWGINGIISKHEGIFEVKLAIKKIMQGEQFVSAAMALPPNGTTMETDKVKISKRESDVMRCVAKGKSILETATMLQLSHHTIIAHRRNIMEKIGVKSVTEMASYIYKNHLF